MWITACTGGDWRSSEKSEQTRCVERRQVMCSIPKNWNRPQSQIVQRVWKKKKLNCLPACVSARCNEAPPNPHRVCFTEFSNAVIELRHALWMSTVKTTANDKWAVHPSTELSGIAVAPVACKHVFTEKKNNKRFFNRSIDKKFD